MKRIILFGATGQLGQEIAKVSLKQGYELTVVVRNKDKAAPLSKMGANVLVLEAINQLALRNTLNDHHIIISALGKSISLNDNSTGSFYEIDYLLNKVILAESLVAGIEKFIYISAFHSKKYKNIAYFEAHYRFEQILKVSGLNYSIVKPTALFSAFLDLVEMAKKGQLFNLGKGDKLTSPIFEGDLSSIIISCIKDDNNVVEVGGKTIYSRKKIN